MDAVWPAPGSEDIKLGVTMGLKVGQSRHCSRQGVRGCVVNGLRHGSMAPKEIQLLLRGCQLVTERSAGSDPPSSQES